MTAMKNGDFTEEELAETKELIINQILENNGSPQGIIELLYQQVMAGTNLSPDSIISKRLQK